MCAASNCLIRSEALVSRAPQTLASIQADFDRIALLTAENAGHDFRYRDYLLGRIPDHCTDVLEIGCGTGEFSRLLATRANKVVAVDLAPQMIHVARRESTSHPNIEFVNGDIMSLNFREQQFDCIVSMTTFHHLPAETIFRKVKEWLKPGGTFAGLDLYRRSTVSDWISDAVAYPLSLCVRLINSGQLRAPRELRVAYDEHGKTDTYLSLREVREICDKVLPGAVVRRHLFWRYSIVWKK